MMPAYIFKRIKNNIQSIKSFKKQRFSFWDTNATSGVTLIELLVVVAMISVLATISFVSFQANPETAKDVKRIAELGQVGAALEFYYATNGRYPTVTPNASALSGGDGINCKPLSEIRNELRPYLFPLPVDPDAPTSDPNNILHYRYSVDDVDNPQKYILTANINKNNYNQDHDAFQSTITKTDVDEVVSEIGVTTNPFCECTEPLGVASDIDTTRTPGNASYKRFCTGAIYVGSAPIAIEDRGLTLPPSIVVPPQTSNPVTRQCTTGDTTKTSGQSCYRCGTQGAWICGQNACVTETTTCGTGKSCSSTGVCLNSYDLSVAQRPDQTTFVLQWSASNASRSASTEYTVNVRSRATTSPYAWSSYTLVVRGTPTRASFIDVANQQKDTIYQLSSGRLFLIPTLSASTTYQFTVRQAGEEESAPLQIATTPKAPTVRVKTIRSNDITLSWSTESYGTPPDVNNKYFVRYWKTEDEKKPVASIVIQQPTTSAIEDRSDINPTGNEKIADLNSAPNEIDLLIPDLDANTEYTFLIQPLETTQSTTQFPHPPIPDRSLFVATYITAKTATATLTIPDRDPNTPTQDSIVEGGVAFSDKIIFYWEPIFNATGYDVQYCTPNSPGTCNHTDESTTTAVNKWKTIDDPDDYVFVDRPTNAEIARLAQRPTSTLSVLPSGKSIAIVTDLSPRTQYQIRVKATGSGGVSSEWGVPSSGVSTIGSGPSGLSVVTRETNSLVVQWTAVSGVTEYSVECITPSCTTQTSPGGTSRVTLTGLSPNTSYVLALQQSNPQKPSSLDYSSITATTLFASPPTGVRVAGATVPLPAVITTVLPSNFANFNPAFNPNILPSSRPTGYSYENAVSTATSLPIQWNAVSGATGYNVRYRKQGTSAQWVRDGVRRSTITGTPTTNAYTPGAIALNNTVAFIEIRNVYNVIDPSTGIASIAGLPTSGGIHGNASAMAVHQGQLYINADRGNGSRLEIYSLDPNTGVPTPGTSGVTQGVNGSDIAAEGVALPQLPGSNNPATKVSGVFVGMTSGGTTPVLYGITSGRTNLSSPATGGNLYTISGRTATKVGSHGLTNPTALMWYDNKLLAFADGGTKIYQLNPATGAKQSGGLELSLPTGISLDGATAVDANYFYGVTKNTTKLYKGAIINDRYVALTESASSQEWIWQQSGSGTGGSWTTLNSSNPNLASSACTGSTCSATISNLDASTVYEVEVQAITSSSTTGWSTPLFRPTREFPSVDPTSVSSRTTSKTITVSWDAWNGVAGVSDAVYQIEYRARNQTPNQEWGRNPYLKSNQTTSPLGRCSVADGTVSCEITKQCSVPDTSDINDAQCDGGTTQDLSSGTEYGLYINTTSSGSFANKSASQNARWIEVIISTDKDPAIASTVQNLATENIAARSMTVKWDTLGSSYNYEMQYRAQGESNWSVEDDHQNTSSTELKLDSLVAGTQYDIRVRAKQTTGIISSTTCTTDDPCVSDWEYTTATTKDVSAPEGLQVRVSASTSLTVSWNYPYDGYYAEDEFVVAYATTSNAYTDKTVCRPTGIFGAAVIDDQTIDHDNNSATAKIRSKVVTVDQLTPSTAYTIMVASKRDISSTNSTCAGATISGTTISIPTSLSVPIVNFRGTGSYVGATTATADVTAASAEYLVVQYKLDGANYSFCENCNREQIVPIAIPSNAQKRITVVRGLSPSTTYNVRVKAGVGDRSTTNFIESDWDNDAGTTLTTLASGPTNIRVTEATPTSVSLSWIGVVNATAYEIHHAPTSNLLTGWGLPDVDSDDNPADAVATITLPAGEYAIRIRANVSGSFTDWSYYATDSAAFEEIGAYSYSPVSRSSLKTPSPSFGTETHTTLPVGWNIITGATGYELEYKEGSGNYLRVAITGGANNGFTITGLDQNKPHIVRIRAISTQGGTRTVSAWSAPVSETTTAVSVPSNLNSTSVTQRTIALSWGSITGTGISYTVEYSTSRTFPTTPPSTATQTRNTLVTGMSLTNLAPGTTYYIRVRANLGSIPGDWSTVIERKTSMYPLNLSVDPATITDTSVGLRWDTILDTSSNHTNFIIQRSKDAEFPSMSTRRVNAVRSATTVSIPNLESNEEYFFQISILYPNGVQSGWVPETPVSVKTLLEAPSDFTATSSPTPSTLTRVGGALVILDYGVATYVTGVTGFTDGLYIAGSNGSSSALQRINTQTAQPGNYLNLGVGTQRGNQQNIFISGMTTHNNKIYVVNTVPSRNTIPVALPVGLYEIQKKSTTEVWSEYTAVRVGSATNFGVGETSPSGLASDGTNLYMVGTTNNKLYRINTTTGVATQVGSQASGFGANITSSNGLSYYSTASTLHMIDANKKFYTLSTSGNTAGVASEVNTLTSATLTISDTTSSALTFHNENMYTLIYNTSYNKYRLYRTAMVNNVGVAWTELSSSAGAIGYEVQYGRVESNAVATWITAPPIINATSATIENLRSGTTYRFRVRAFTNIDKGAWSTEASQTIPGTATPITGTAPITALATATNPPITQHSISLTWASATTTSNPIYEVQYSSNSAFPATIRTTTTSATLNNLTAGTQYSIRVRQVGASAWSSSISEMTSRPSAPTNVQRRGSITLYPHTKSYHATIEWGYPSDTNPVEFEIQYSTDKTFQNALVTETITAIPGSSNQEIMGLTASTKYYVRVQAVGKNTNTNRESGWGTPESSQTTEGGILYFETPAIPEPTFYSVRRDTQDPTRFTLTYFARFATEYEVQSCGVSATIVCNQTDPDNSTDWSPIQTTTATPGTQTTYSTTVLLAQQDTTYYFRIRAKHNTQVSVWAREQAR